MKLIKSEEAFLYSNIIKQLYAFNFDVAYGNILKMCEYVLTYIKDDEISNTIAELTQAMNNYDIIKIVDLLKYILCPIYKEIVLINNEVK